MWERSLVKPEITPKLRKDLSRANVAIYFYIGKEMEEERGEQRLPTPAPAWSPASWPLRPQEAVTSNTCYMHQLPIIAYINLVYHKLLKSYLLVYSVRRIDNDCKLAIGNIVFLISQYMCMDYIHITESCIINLNMYVYIYIFIYIKPIHFYSYNKTNGQRV